MISSNYNTDLNLPCIDCVTYAICNSINPRLIFDCILVRPHVHTLLKVIDYKFFSNVNAAQYKFKSIVKPFEFSVSITRYITNIVIVELVDQRNRLISYPKVFDLI